MAAIISVLLLALIFFFNSVALANIHAYGAMLCKDTTNYACHIVKRGDKWAKLFPNPQQQDIVMRVNRIGIELEPGMRIAIPHNLSYSSAMDFSPLPRAITPPGEKLIYVSLDKMAWGAYDAQGTLLRWGPVSSAQGYCPDLGHGCHTAKGKFEVYRKEGKNCVSTRFPIGRGGAPMPYCMFFHGGFALHGSYEVPGYNASHGCIRMMVGDAQWLNEEFLPKELHTVVIVSQQ